MTEQEIRVALAEIIEEFIGVPGSDVIPEANLVDDLGIDSLSLVEIVVAAQDKFGVEIPDSDLKLLKTVHDVTNYVQRSTVSA
jgi:acyl carrier protein